MVRELMMIRVIFVSLYWHTPGIKGQFRTSPGNGGELRVEALRPRELRADELTEGTPHQVARSLAANVPADRSIRNSVVGSVISRAFDTLICVHVL